MPLSTRRTVSFGYVPPRRSGRDHVRRCTTSSTAIARGSLTGLLGPNGCGKTTLLKLLAGVLQPDAGTVALDGRDVADLRAGTLAQAHRRRAAGDPSGVRLHGARDGADGTAPASRRVPARGSRRSRDRARGA